MPPKKKTKSAFPEEIKEFINQYYQKNLEAYNKTKDHAAYAQQVYADLNKQFYTDNGDSEWEQYDKQTPKQNIVKNIEAYIKDYIPTYQKQQREAAFSKEEQQTQSLIQKYNSHNAYEAPLKESNNEEVSNQILALDAMSRFFAKNPYSSLVYKVSETQSWYLGINSDQKEISLSKIPKKDFSKNPNVLKTFYVK